MASFSDMLSTHNSLRGAARALVTASLACWVLVEHFPQYLLCLTNAAQISNTMRLETWHFYPSYSELNEWDFIQSNWSISCISSAHNTTVLTHILQDFLNWVQLFNFRRWKLGQYHMGLIQSPLKSMGVFPWTSMDLRYCFYVTTFFLHRERENINWGYFSVKWSYYTDPSQLFPHLKVNCKAKSHSFICKPQFIKYV